MGNIGLNLLLALRRSGVEAVGVEVSRRRRAELAERQVPGVHDRPEAAGDIDTWIFATSTGPNLSHLMSAVSAVAPRPGALLSVESTLPAGTMAMLGEHFRQRGFQPGRDLYLVHLPHRILFGVEESVFDAARVIAGLTPECLQQGIAFYGPLISNLFPVADVRIAELSKIVENTLRFVEVACAEELFRYCQTEGLDFHQLRAAVNTKGNVRLLDVDYGIGGECLPKDIRFLQAALDSPLLAGAMAADDRYQAMLRAAAGCAGRVLIHGITYKPGYPDVKFSMAVELARALQAEGKQVFVYDLLLTPDQVAELGFAWGDPDGAYDLVYRRPMQMSAPERGGNKEESHVEDSGHGQQGHPGQGSGREADR
ncbi:MAG TPA: nucleotide sugar dehydrogenase [Symbiobacteriaceae bacterium]